MADIVSDHFGVPLEVEGHSGQHDLFHDFPGLNTCPLPTISWTLLSTSWNPALRAHCISGMSGMEPGVLSVQLPTWDTDDCATPPHEL